jgi:hypothetical protein
MIAPGHFWKIGYYGWREIEGDQKNFAWSSKEKNVQNEFRPNFATIYLLEMSEQKFSFFSEGLREWGFIIGLNSIDYCHEFGFSHFCLMHIFKVIYMYCFYSWHAFIKVIFLMFSACSSQYCIKVWRLIKN